MCMLELPQLPEGKDHLKVPGKSHHPAFLSSGGNKEVRIMAAWSVRASYRAASARQHTYRNRRWKSSGARTGQFCGKP